MAKKTYTNSMSGQSAPIPGREDDMVLNNAGGFVFKIDEFSRLRRFLILGSEGGTYYVSERALTVQNAQNALRCIRKDGKAVVDMVVQVSHEGLAPSNDPALFVLALAAKMGDGATRKAAYDALPKVARIGTHLYHFVAFVESIGDNSGWSRGMRTAIQKWFNDKSPQQVEYQLTKYQQRDGWSAADLLRLAHPIPPSELHKGVYSWAVDGWTDDQYAIATPGSNDLIYAVEAAKRTTTIEGMVQLIQAYHLEREHIPTTFLNYPAVWDALLPNLKLEATLRNLAKMTAVGLLTKNSDATNLVVGRFSDPELIRKSRMHPLKALIGMRTYLRGQGMLGHLTWNPITSITNAAESMFYAAFHNVQPTGKMTMLAVDCSGSMGALFMNMPIRVIEAAAVMAMVSKRAEGANAVITGFSAGRTYSTRDSGIQVLGISENEPLESVMRKMLEINWGGTDCSLPMKWASQQRVAFDGFSVYTDNETWAGSVHPSKELHTFRTNHNPNARLVVAGLTATDFSIADPKDSGMLDVVGFSADTPGVIGDFLAGRI